MTDKPDYAAGETALISATGYQLGEAVKFQVVHIDGTPNTGGGHEPWSVQDGGAGDLDGIVDGNVKTSWYVNPDDSLGAVFELSALGLSSGAYALYNFTDAGPPSVDQLFQWDPGNTPDTDWVTGNNNGPYVEGDTVPYYTSLSNLIVGNTYSLTIEWDTTKDSKHAIDYLRSYDATISFPPAVDPAADAGVNVVTTDTIAIPEDTFMTSRPNFNGVQEPGVFKIYNGDLTSVSTYTTPVAYVGDTSTSVTVFFVAQDDGVGDATTRVVLTWGGHIASRQTWGQLFSAVDIPGSPYHMRLEEFTDVTNNDDLNVGNTDRSLSADAVIFPATITVIKDAIPDDAQDFGFTTTGVGLSNFTLDDDGDNNNGTSNTQVFTVSDFTDKTITESLVAGWDLTSIQIVEVGGIADSTFNVGSRIANLEVQEGENITVTFTNVKQSSITVVKDAIPNALADFSFTSTIAGGANFQLDDDAGVVGADNTLLNSVVFSNPAPGIYTVTEAALAGWDLTQLVINDPDNGSSVDLVNRTATIDLDVGESITVTFTNTQRGRIIVEKQTNPDGSLETFEFDPSYPGANFLLADNGQNDSGLLAPGSYTVQELAEAGWDLTNIEIVSGDLDAGSTTNVGTGTATIDLDAGEVITVRFTNTQRGRIIVEKQTNPDGSLETFEFDPSYPGANFFLADGQTSDSGQLVPGSYSVQELAEAGWDLSNIEIVSGDLDAGSTTNVGTGTATIDLDAGEVITVRFTNTQQGRIIVEKQTNPDGSLETFEFDPSYPGANFFLADNGQNNSGLLAPGSYTVQELAEAGWDLTNIEIVSGDLDAGSTTNVGTRTATIDLDAGEVITIRFTNTQRGRIIVEKQTNPDGSLETFEFDPSYPGANFFLADGQTSDSGQLVPGSYSVQELAEAGWDLSNIEIVSGDLDAGSTTNVGTRTATIDLDAGEVITVRFTNTQQGRIIVEKQTNPDGSLETFEFDPSYPGANFFLADNGQNNSGLLAPGSYTVQELAEAGWDLTNIEIVSGDLDAGSITNVGTRTATIDLDAGEVITIRFTNTQQGRIIVEKQTNPDGSLETFEFDPSYPGANFLLADGQTNDSGLLIPGSYSVQELAEAGWDLSNIEIVSGDLDAGSTTNVGTRTATIDLDAGEVITVRFTNTQRSGLTIIKDAIPNALADFSFTSALLGNFQLDDDSGVLGGDNTLLNSINFSNLVPGNYVVTEAALAGWDLTGLVINDPDNGSSVDLVNRTATIDLDAGESITVTFTNTQRGRIIVEKQTNPDGSVETFEFDSNYGANFLLGDGQTNDSGLLIPGSYSVQELAEAGWDLTNIEIVSGDLDAGSTTNEGTRTATIDLDAGEVITVRFTNTQRGRIIVEKQTLPDGSLETFEFDSTYGANFLLADGQNNDSGLLVPGSYTVQELAEAGWDLVNVQIVSGDLDAGSSTNEFAGAATIDLDAGEVITVRFTNAQRGSVTVIKDAVPNHQQEFLFASNLPSPVFLLDDDAGAPGEDATFSNSQLFSNVVLGTYGVTEFPVPGWALTNIVINDPDGGSSINLATGTATIDLDPGEAITVTFVNTLQLGSIAWEKRATDTNPVLLPGATFTITPSPLDGGASLVVADGGPNDADGLVNGSFLVNNVLPGVYTVTETVAPAGYAIDNDADRIVTVAPGEAAVIGTQGTDQPGDGDESDFHNRLGSIAWEKRREPDNLLQGGATFQISPNPLTGAGTLVVVDNGANDANPIAGQILVVDVLLDDYTVTETVPPPGYTLDDDATRTVTVSESDLNAIIGIMDENDPGNTEESDFHNPVKRIVITPDKSANSLPYVHIVNAATGELLVRFKAYDEGKADAVSYRGGVRVATGDINGDGIPEIITAPGRNYRPLVRIWDQNGVLLEQFLAYGATFKGGVDVAVGDVNADGQNDIATAMSYNGNEVKVFRNPAGPSINFGSPNAVAPHFTKFSPFGTFKGGATVRVADMGRVLNGGTKTLNNFPDGRAELIVGNGPGMRSTIYVYGFYALPQPATTSATAYRVRTMLPFGAGFKGGISLDVARVNADLVPEIIVAAGNGGGSRVQVRNGINGAVLKQVTAYSVGETPQAPVHVAAVDDNGDGIAETFLTAQGCDGSSRKIRRFDFNPLNPSAVDEILESHPDFFGAYFVEDLSSQAILSLA